MVTDYLLPQFVWGELQAQGQKLVKEGKTLEADEENLAELTEKSQGFAEKQVMGEPVWDHFSCIAMIPFGYSADSVSDARSFMDCLNSSMSLLSMVLCIHT
jgi:hypothetical protein